MLFSSLEFIFFFLPITLIGFHLIGRQGFKRTAIAWLIAASLFFYGWWNPPYLVILLMSAVFNYGTGSFINKASKQSYKKTLLVIGIVFNLGMLGYFKYANFFIYTVNDIGGNNIVLEQIILPLAISFFTFQQIAYLVDVRNDKAEDYSFLHYSLFVVFFPQLIAGPIVHHKEIFPQFIKDSFFKINSKNLAIGLTIFVVGLFKKVVLADGISIYATPVFNAAELGLTLTFFEAWFGALAYTFQLYFDFSGYSDMAVGIGMMFGIRLPINFNSPYKSLSIIDFWRRWHITLSRFLKYYLYIPLGGSKKGKTRRYVNLMITMLLGGLWHGAGWTFILWGGLHGFYLIINHGWRSIFKSKTQSKFISTFSWFITFLAIVIAWVPFRAETIEGAKRMLSGMIGQNGISLPRQLKPLGAYIENNILGTQVLFNDLGTFGSNKGLVFLAILFFIVLIPKRISYFSQYEILLEKIKLGASHAFISALYFYIAIIFIYFGFKTEFLYFQF